VIDVDKSGDRLAAKAKALGIELPKGPHPAGKDPNA
jgi:hypothetical protein